VALSPPQSAAENYRLSALIAQRAASQARATLSQGPAAVARVVAAHQITQAVMAEPAVAAMLAEQRIQAPADARLTPTAFTTDAQTFTAMYDASGAVGLERLVESLVQDAGRAAESVAAAVRPNVYHVRYLSPPSCSRCAVLAGRVYRWSDGFLRHPHCDCTLIPTRSASPLRQSPDALVAAGQVTDLSKADRKAVADGADLGHVVNIRRRQAGLSEAGSVLSRDGRLTPAGIYRLASDREHAVKLLRTAGYIT
jgi:hypothetical protein